MLAAFKMKVVAAHMRGAQMDPDPAFRRTPPAMPGDGLFAPGEPGTPPDALPHDDRAPARRLEPDEFDGAEHDGAEPDPAEPLRGGTLTRGRTTRRSLALAPMPRAKREKQILAVLMAADRPLHRDQIASAIDLAPTRVRNICDNLCEVGVLDLTRVRNPLGGRPMHLYSPSASYRASVASKRGGEP